MPYQSFHIQQLFNQLKDSFCLVQIKSADYSPCFIAYFLELVALSGIIVKHCSLEDLTNIQQSIFDSDQSTLLFLGHIESAEQYKTIQKILLQMSNQRICFSYNRQIQGYNNPMLELHLDALSTAEHLEELWYSFSSMIELSRPLMRYLSTYLMRYHTPIMVEQACSILKYMPLMQNFSTHELIKITDSLLERKYSLFELSALFFSNNKTLFFQQWSEVQLLYPPIFWISYWSDQLFRAYCYVYAKQSLSNVPKAAGARLPFSFVNKDYRLADLNSIATMHALLCNYDQRLKQGLTANMTLILHQWFLD